MLVNTKTRKAIAVCNTEIRGYPNANFLKDHLRQSGYRFIDGCVRSDDNSFVFLAAKYGKIKLYQINADLNSAQPIYDLEIRNPVSLCYDPRVKKFNILQRSGYKYDLHQVAPGGTSQKIKTYEQSVLGQSRRLTVRLGPPEGKPPTAAVPEIVELLEDQHAASFRIANLSANDKDQAIIQVTARSLNKSICSSARAYFVAGEREARIILNLVPNMYTTEPIVVEVAVEDDGPNNSRAVYKVKVNVKAVNDPPTLKTPKKVVISKNQPEQWITLEAPDPGPFEHDEVKIAVESSDRSVLRIEAMRLDENKRTRVQLQGLQSGFAELRVYAIDSGAENNSSSKTISVDIQEAPFNPPTVSYQSKIELKEDSDTTTIHFTDFDANDSGQRILAVELISTEIEKYFEHQFSYDPGQQSAALTLKPRRNQYSASPIMATLKIVDDGANNSTTEIPLAISLLAVNDAPDFDIASQLSVPFGESKIEIANVTAGPLEQDKLVFSLSDSSETQVIREDDGKYYLAISSTQDSAPRQLTITLSDGQQSVQKATRIRFFDAKAAPSKLQMLLHSQRSRTELRVVLQEDQQPQAASNFVYLTGDRRSVGGIGIDASRKFIFYSVADYPYLFKQNIETREVELLDFSSNEMNEMNEANGAVRHWTGIFGIDPTDNNVVIVKAIGIQRSQGLKLFKLEKDKSGRYQLRDFATLSTSVSSMPLALSFSESGDAVLLFERLVVTIDKETTEQSISQVVGLPGPVGGLSVAADDSLYVTSTYSNSSQLLLKGVKMKSGVVHFTKLLNFGYNEAAQQSRSWGGRNNRTGIVSLDGHLLSTHAEEDRLQFVTNSLGITEVSVNGETTPTVVSAVHVSTRPTFSASASGTSYGLNGKFEILRFKSNWSYERVGVLKGIDQFDRNERPNLRRFDIIAGHEIPDSDKFSFLMSDGSVRTVEPAEAKSGTVKSFHVSNDSLTKSKLKSITKANEVFGRSQFIAAAEIYESGALKSIKIEVIDAESARIVKQFAIDLNWQLDRSIRGFWAADFSGKLNVFVLDSREKLTRIIPGNPKVTEFDLKYYHGFESKLHFIKNSKTGEIDCLQLSSRLGVSKIDLLTGKVRHRLPHTNGLDRHLVYLAATNSNYVFVRMNHDSGFIVYQMDADSLELTYVTEIAIPDPKRKSLRLDGYLFTADSESDAIYCMLLYRNKILKFNALSLKTEILEIKDEDKVNRGARIFTWCFDSVSKNLVAIGARQNQEGMALVRYTESNGHFESTSQDFSSSECQLISFHPRLRKVVGFSSPGFNRRRAPDGRGLIRPKLSMFVLDGMKWKLERELPIYHAPKFVQFTR